MAVPLRRLGLRDNRSLIVNETTRLTLKKWQGPGSRGAAMYIVDPWKAIELPLAQMALAATSVRRAGRRG